MGATLLKLAIQQQNNKHITDNEIENKTFLTCKRQQPPKKLDNGIENKTFLTCKRQRPPKKWTEVQIHKLNEPPLFLKI